MDRLDGAAAIALVSGVRGSGRTSLVASWAGRLAASGVDVRWVAGSAGLTSPSAFWSEVIGSADGSLGRFVEVLAASDSPSLVVLDDADIYLTAAHVAELVELVRRSPRTRLVIIGHTLPGAPASVAVTKIRSRELHASADELAAIAESVGLQMPQMALDAVHNSFQGWLGPSLVVLRAMMEALAEGRAPEHAYELAMETAAVFVRDAFGRAGAIDALKPLWLWQRADELTAESARVAIGVDHPHLLIAGLEDEGAVRSIPDSTPPAWTPNLSPVLAGLLTEEFSQRFADETRAAHRRLSTWRLENGDESGAVTHAIAAEDWESVTGLLNTHWSTLLSTSPETLRASMNALPQHFLDSNPRWIEARNFVNFMPSGDSARSVKYRHTAREATGGLVDVLATLTSRTAAFRFSGQFDEAAATAVEAEEALRDAADDDRSAVAHVLPELRVQWGISFELAGDASRALEVFEEAYDDALQSGNTRMAVDAAGNSALILAIGGSTASAVNWLTRMPAFTDDEQSAQPVHTVGNMARAILALDRLDIDEARSISDTRFNAARSPEQWAIREWILAQIAAVSGDPLARLTTLRAVLAEKSPAAWSSGINKWLVIVAQADLLIASGQATAAAALLEGARAPSATGTAPATAPPASLTGDVDTARARAAIFAGEFARAADIALRHVRAGTAGVRTLAELLLVVAVTDAAAGRVDEATSRFRSALELIETHALPLLLARAPRAALDTLLSHSVRELDDETVRRVSATNALSTTVNPGTTLSRRERDVLRALVAGTSIDQIAREQFVTRNTVKSQVRSIYKKLGTSSREETVRIARTLPEL